MHQGKCTVAAATFLTGIALLATRMGSIYVGAMEGVAMAFAGLPWSISMLTPCLPPACPHAPFRRPVALVVADRPATTDTRVTTTCNALCRMGTRTREHATFSECRPAFTDVEGMRVFR